MKISGNFNNVQFTKNTNNSVKSEEKSTEIKGKDKATELTVQQDGKVHWTAPIPNADLPAAKAAIEAAGGKILGYNSPVPGYTKIKYKSKEKTEQSKSTDAPLIAQNQIKDLVLNDKSADKLKRAALNNKNLLTQANQSMLAQANQDTSRRFDSLM